MFGKSQKDIYHETENIIFCTKLYNKIINYFIEYISLYVIRQEKENKQCHFFPNKKNISYSLVVSGLVQ